MPEKASGRLKYILIILLMIAIVIFLAAFLFRSCRQKQNHQTAGLISQSATNSGDTGNNIDTKSPVKSTMEKTVVPIEQGEVVEFHRQPDKNNDTETQNIMGNTTAESSSPNEIEQKQRKQTAGFDDSVDLIVKPGESIKIGAMTIPMKEILDKIKIQKGGISENNLSAGITPSTGSAESIGEKIESIKDRLEKIESILAGKSESLDADSLKKLQNEQNRLKAAIKLSDEYESAAGAVTDLEEKIQKQREKEGKADEKLIRELEKIKQRRQALRAQLSDLIADGDGLETYGIYVVKPGDNIWDIHFRFLSDYFQQKGIRLSPVADEPDTRGFSSGVGKILKFSEKMVSIFNIRERKLDMDLNNIEPLTKIVIFNMGKILSLLKDIDDEKVKHVRFDGENIWIPANS